jgi:hypothetical protein
MKEYLGHLHTIRAQDGRQYVYRHLRAVSPFCLIHYHPLLFLTGGQPDFGFQYSYGPPVKLLRRVFTFFLNREFGRIRPLWRRESMKIYGVQG